MIKYNWIVLLLTVGFLMQALKKERSRSHDLLEYRKVMEQELKVWQSKAGDSYAQSKSLEIEARNIKTVLGKKKVSELKKEVGNVRRNLISYQNVKTNTSGKVSTSLSASLDTTNRTKSLLIKRIDFSDSFFSMSGSYNPLNDSLVVNYQVENSFEIFHYYERPGKPPFNIFRRKHAVVKIKFDNPKSEANNLLTFRLSRR